jgi:NitT/TauT family transport system substrate-binding protein
MFNVRRALYAVLAASVLAAPVPGRAQATAVVHLGTSGKEADAQAYFAADMGFFKKRGLTVQIDTMPNGAAIASGVASGALQFGDSNLITIATAREKGIPFVLVAGGGQYSTAAPTTLMVTAPNNPARSAKDLNGKIVAGVSLKGLDDMVAHAWIDQNGGDSTTIKYVELPPAEMVAALERGTVDAVLLPEPALSAGRSRVRILGKAYDAVAKQFLISGWFASPEWAAKNPAVVKAFAEAVAESAQWANANREKAAAILEKYTKIEVDPGAAHVRITFAQSLDPTLIQPVIDAGARYKIIAKPYPAADMMWK